jgi:hypothetical protein
MRTLDLTNKEASDIKYQVLPFPDGQQQVVIDKKSLKGLCCVELKNQHVFQECDWETENDGDLHVIYENGIFSNQTTFKEIRKRISKI